MDVSHLLNTYLLVNAKQDLTNIWFIITFMFVNYMIKHYRIIYRNFIDWFEANIYKRVNVRFQIKIPLSFVNSPIPYKSNKLLGILYYLQTSKINAPEFEEIYLPMLYEDDESSSSYLLPLLSHYKIADDIYVSIDTDIELENKESKRNRNRRYDEETDEKHDRDMKIINVSLCSYKHNVSYVNDFIDKKEEIYINYKNKDNNKLKIFTTSTYFDHDIGSNALKFNKYYLSSNKSFDTLFFDGKEQIITRLDRYNKNISEYRRLGIPHTLGFLFHGIPGCGKTSCIKAIANYTNRSIISVNMNHITCIEDLIKLFNSENLAYTKVELNKRIYVFEEIDCYDYFLAREFVKEEPKEEPKMEDVLTDLMNKKKLKNKKKDDSKITLGQILEVLDGIIECNDRIIVFTTNHVEKIDKALIRPGRIDLIVDFKKLRKQDIQDLFRLWFHRDIPERDFKAIKDYCVTQADFGKLCFEHMNQPMKIISHLVRL